ncbi:MAG: ShlB/FhaC/HecB family hemolysin secretion/activation protein [Burkholderiaceae bacterium]
MAADVPSSPPASTPATVTASPVVTAPAPTGATFYVDGPEYRYAVSGNNLLPQATIEAILKTAATPKAAVDAINNAFADAGYLLVVIGGQVENKLVALQIIQGRITQIDAPPEYLPFVRSLLERDDITRNQLIRETAMVDFYGQRQGVSPRPTFAKAEQVGGTKLVITEEPIPGARPWSAGLVFSNLSGRFSSRYTVGGSAAVRPGNGLELTATYNQGLPGLTSESAGASYKSGTLGASIVTPWGLYGLSYAKTDYQIGESGAPFYPSGELEQGGVNGTQIVFATPSSRVTTTQSLMHYSNRQTVDIDAPERFTLVEQDYDVVSAGAGYNGSFSLFGQNTSFGGSVTVAKGISSPSGTFLPADLGIPDPRFLLLQANASAQMALPYDLSAGLTLTLQHSDSTLPQAQQWVLGGFGNLSAWLPAVLVGDSGLLGRATVNTSSYLWGAFSFSGGVFAEAGVSRMDYRARGEPYTRGLGDIGLSVVGSTTTGTTLTLAYAVPVWYRNVNGAVRESADSNRAQVYFTLNQTF